jgi:hypothetical protein
MNILVIYQAGDKVVFSPRTMNYGLPANFKLKKELHLDERLWAIDHGL